MADPRTFTLIGEFKDGITPELEKINKQLATLKANFAGVGSRKNTGFRGATKEIGKLVAAHKNLASSVKEVRSELSSTIGVLQQYRREMGKAGAATRAFQKAGGSMGSEAFTRNMRNANTQAREYLKTLQQINAQSNRVPRMPRGGMGGGGGGGTGRVRPPGSGGRGSGGGGMGAHMGEFGFAYTLGASIAQPIQSAIISGFQIGVGFMTKPFEYFAGAFGERVQDQLSDLQSAGGLLSISKRSKTPFLSTMQEAIQYQQDTNKVFANMAGTLPGVTNDYVQVGKRLSDTVARVVTGDFANALKQANAIRNTEEGRQFYVKKGEAATITGQGPEAQRQVMTTLLGDMTKFTTLAGIGGRTGAGGVTGAYGLPGLTERMIGQAEVSVSQFQRYASVFSNPMVADALKRNVDLINKTVPDTAARVAAMRKLLQEIVTPELIDELRTSVDGVYQGLKASLFDPDKGLFGLGRQFTNFGKAMNGYGQYVDKAGKVVTDMTQAADADLSLFEIVANIFSNFGQVLQPLVDFLPEIFDPLKKVATLLKDARYYTGELARTFNTYRESLINLSKTNKYKYLQGTIDIRAALGSINNMMRALGVISKADFTAMGGKLMSEGFQAGPVIKEMIDKVLNSDIAESIGSTIGEIVGTVLTEVAQVTGFISGRLKGSNKLFDGLKKGFDAAKGTEAFKNIFKDVFTAMLEVLKKLLQIIPFEAYMLAALAVVAPAVVQGLAMSFASRIWGAFQKFFEVAGNRMVDALRNQGARFTGPDLSVQGVTVGDLGNTPKLLPPAGGTSASKGGALAKGGGALAKAMSGVTSFFTKLNSFFKGVGPRFMGFFKGFLGKLSIFGAILTSIVSLFQGKDLATSLAEGAGPLFGAALGAALVPFLGPIGPMIGSAIGGWIGSMRPVVDTLTGYFKGIGYAINMAWQAIGPALEAIGGILQTIWNGLMGLIPGMDGLASSFDFLNVAFIATKVAFYPFLRGLLDIAQGLQETKLALLYFDKWLNKTFQQGDRQGRLQAQIDKTEDQNAALKRTIAKLNAELLKPLPSPKPPKPPGLSTTPATPAKPKTAVDAALLALGGDPTKKLNLPTVTGAGAKGGTGVDAALRALGGDPAKKLNLPTVTGAGGTTTIPKDLQKTAQTPAAVKTGTDKTTAAVKELTAKITSQSSLQTSVAAIYNLLASGMLRVQTNMAGMMGMPGGFAGTLPGTGNPVIPPSVIPPGGVIAGADYSQFGAKPPNNAGFAFGPSNPAFFSTTSAAEKWERSMVRGSIKVGSITGNSSEGFGGGTTINGGINVTVNGSGVNDADALASMVAMKIGEAVADARAASVFV
jgi:hypothetical protein